MDKIRIGFIGYGYWGPNLLRNFYAHAEIETVWVCDLIQKNLDKVKKQYPTIQITKNHIDLLQDPTIQVIVVAVPTPFHYEIVRQCLLAGKHVFVEKPMTETVEQAEKIVALARKKKLKLFVDHPFIFSSAVQKMKELIDSDELGKLYYYDSLRLNMGLIQLKTNVITDLAPHDFSILDYLCGGKQPISIQVSGSTHIGKKQEELAHIHLRYPKGFVANITLSWLSPLKVRQIMLVGEKAMIRYDDTEPSEKIRVYDKGVSILKTAENPFQPQYRSGDIVIPKIDQTETLTNVVQACIDTIRGKKEALNDGDAGLRVVRLLSKTQKLLRRARG
ncbi:MAG: Gfo/Idh/MocA family oxidoreductase [Candidatus Pacebacteria bacterium]|nr:Gfo/Idh/MocA family oxidoreductase [Candidatus Paceibacterota bacterium]